MEEVELVDKRIVYDVSGVTMSRTNGRSNKKRRTNQKPKNYTKPFLVAPSIIDYDKKTGYITFGEYIDKPSRVKHPRRYRHPIMPVIDTSPLTCRHSYCLVERKRVAGYPIELKPKGLPWATGLLPYLPGKVKYKYPIPKSYQTYPPTKREERLKNKGKEKQESIGQINARKQLDCIKQELCYFFSVIMLAGMVISNKRKSLGEDIVVKEEDEEDDGEESAGEEKENGEEKK